MNTDRIKEIIASYERRMKEDKERGFLETFQSSSPEDAEFKRKYTTGIQPIDGDLNQNEQVLDLRKRLAKVSKTYHYCGREQRYIVGEQTFNVGGRSITLDEILYAYCDTCDASTFSSEVAGEIEYRLKAEFERN